MAGEEVNGRWQTKMAPFFEDSGQAADRMMHELVELFHLDCAKSPARPASSLCSGSHDFLDVLEALFDRHESLG
jgi:hypothetical protein